MNTQSKFFLFVSVLAILCFAAQPVVAQSNDLITEEVVVTVTDTKDGHTTTLEKTFPNEAAADVYLFKNGYSQSSLQTTKDVGINNREVKVITRTNSSRGLIDAKTGEANLSNIVYYPANATIKELADGSKEITWNETDVDGELYPVRTIVKVHSSTPKF